MGEEEEEVNGEGAMEGGNEGEREGEGGGATEGGANTSIKMGQSSRLRSQFEFNKDLPKRTVWKAVASLRETAKVKHRVREISVGIEENLQKHRKRTNGVTTNGAERTTRILVERNMTILISEPAGATRKAFSLFPTHRRQDRLLLPDRTIPIRARSMGRTFQTTSFTNNSAPSTSPRRRTLSSKS